MWCSLQASVVISVQREGGIGSGLEKQLMLSVDFLAREMNVM